MRKTGGKDPFVTKRRRFSPWKMVRNFKRRFGRKPETGLQEGLDNIVCDQEDGHGNTAFSRSASTRQEMPMLQKLEKDVGGMNEKLSNLIKGVADLKEGLCHVSKHVCMEIGDISPCSSGFINVEDGNRSKGSTEAGSYPVASQGSRQTTATYLASQPPTEIRCEVHERQNSPTDTEIPSADLFPSPNDSIVFISDPPRPSPPQHDMPRKTAIVGYFILEPQPDGSFLLRRLPEQLAIQAHDGSTMPLQHTEPVDALHPGPVQTGSQDEPTMLSPFTGIPDAAPPTPSAEAIHNWLLQTELVEETGSLPASLEDEIEEEGEERGANVLGRDMDRKPSMLQPQPVDILGEEMVRDDPVVPTQPDDILGRMLGDLPVSLTQPVDVLGEMLGDIPVAPTQPVDILGEDMVGDLPVVPIQPVGAVGNSLQREHAIDCRQPQTVTAADEFQLVFAGLSELYARGFAPIECLSVDNHRLIYYILQNCGFDSFMMALGMPFGTCYSSELEQLIALKTGIMQWMSTCNTNSVMAFLQMMEQAKRRTFQ